MLEKYSYQESDNGLNKVIIILCFLLLIILFFLFIILNKNHQSEMDTLPLENVDMKSFEEPIQGYPDRTEKATITRTNRGAKVDIIPRATYKIYGRVLTKHSVPAHVEMGELMPYDMVIAWGKMAEPEMFKLVKFEYEFYDRYVWWTFSSKIKDDADELSNCFSNNHIIPSNKIIRKELDNVKVKNIVYMEGFLTDLVVYNDGFPMKLETSLWRDDAGSGACEILYVTRLVTHNGDFR